MGGSWEPPRKVKLAPGGIFIQNGMLAIFFVFFFFGNQADKWTRCPYGTAFVGGVSPSSPHPLLDREGSGPPPYFCWSPSLALCLWAFGSLLLHQFHLHLPQVKLKMQLKAQSQRRGQRWPNGPSRGWKELHLIFLCDTYSFCIILHTSFKILKIFQHFHDKYALS